MRAGRGAALGGAAAVALMTAGGAAAADPWTELSPGLEVARFDADGAANPAAGAITVLRVHPSQWQLRIFSNDTGEPSGNRSVRRCLEDENLAVAVNAGMYATDYLTHLGYLGCGEERNNPRVNAYRSVAAFEPLVPDAPPFRIFDLDETEFPEIRGRYRCLVQNLRLIKRSRENRWPQQGRKWSEVALGEDVRGRVLLIHSRDAYSMHDLNEILFGLPIDVVAAQHLEGGPEAQLVYRDGDRGVVLIGAFDPVVFQPGQGASGLPVPNVLGIVRRGE
jgi:hypothetical protein